QSHDRQGEYRDFENCDGLKFAIGWFCKCSRQHQHSATLPNDRGSVAQIRATTVRECIVSLKIVMG
ncbi:MAG: hypothetical protein Q8M03_12610, partial [Legionella sp.]|nr:hypothetical protein [Legionella sp.]